MAAVSVTKQKERLNVKVFSFKNLSTFSTKHCNDWNTALLKDLEIFFSGKRFLLTVCHFFVVQHFYYSTNFRFSKVYWPLVPSLQLFRLT